MKYWFYAKIESPRPDSPSEVYYPLVSKVEMFEHTYQSGFNSHSPEFKSCMTAFKATSKAYGGRDLVEEFIAAGIWPLSPGWYPFSLKRERFSCLAYEINCPVLGLVKPKAVNEHSLVSEVERDACTLLGPWNRREYDSLVAICKHAGRINRCFKVMNVNYESQPVPPPPLLWSWGGQCRLGVSRQGEEEGEGGGA